jgi:hypothetical protein
LKNVGDATTLAKIRENNDDWVVGELKKLLRGTHFKGLLYGAALMVAVHVIGTVGYMTIGGPTVTWIDSFLTTTLSKLA